jgi:hypothetical protein
MLPNPWLLLALVVAWGMSLVVADDFGYNRAIDEREAARALALDAAIGKANLLGATDTTAAVKVEKEIIYKRDLQREKQHELELDIERKAREDAERRAANPQCKPRSCDLDLVSYRLLLATVRGANEAKTPAAGDAGDKAGAAARAPGRARGDDPPVAK